MSDFIESLTDFLTVLKNNVLEETHDNKIYSELKSKSIELSGMLLAAVSEEQVSLIIRFLDDFAAIGNYETKYCYLRGLRDCNKPEVQFNPASDAGMNELSSHEQYTAAKTAITAAREELKCILSAEKLAILDEYYKVKNTMLGIEKSYCYPGGMRDKRRLDNLINTLAEEWFLDAFL